MKIYGHDNVTVLPTNPIEGRCVFLSPDGMTGALWYYNGYSWISLDTTDYARYKPQGERHLVLLEPTPATRFYWDPVDSAPNSQVAEVLPSGTVVSIAADIELPMAQDVYTFFAANSSTHQVLPNVVETSIPGNFIRGYAGGIFKLGADLTDPAGILDSDVMCGIVVTGTNTNYSARLVVNGVELLATSDTVPLTSLSPVLDTTLPLCSPSALNGLTGYLHSFSAVFNNVPGDFEVASQWNTSVVPHQPISLKSFDTLGVKFGWFVDQNTLSTAVEVQSMFYTKPPQMLTTTQHSPPIGGLFNWNSLPDYDLGGVNSAQYYDATTATLNVRLGGFGNNSEAWTWTGSEGVDVVTGIYYNLGYSPSIPYVIAGVYSTVDDKIVLQAGLVINPLNHPITNQTIAAPVVFTSNSGIFSYPAASATPTPVPEARIQALNIGQPVLFEMWYSRMS